MRVTIADDAGLVRDGVELLLSRAGIDVVDSVEDGPSLLAAVERDLPDVVLLDMRMPPSDRAGLTIAVELRRRYPALGLLVFTAEPSAEDAIEVIRLAGPTGVGYLSKDALRDVAHLITELERVATGGCGIDRIVPTTMLRRSSRRAFLERLTATEREVVEYMAMGLTNAGIAKASGRTASTVGVHVKTIYRKLGVHESEVDRRTMVVLAALDGRDLPLER